MCLTLQRYETTETYVLVNQTGEDMCQPHLFSVVAMDDAGESSASIMMESIPLSEIMISVISISGAWRYSFYAFDMYIPT